MERIITEVEAKQIAGIPSLEQVTEGKCCTISKASDIGAYVVNKSKTENELITSSDISTGMAGIEFYINSPAQEVTYVVLSSENCQSIGSPTGSWSTRIMISPAGSSNNVYRCSVTWMKTLKINSNYLEVVDAVEGDTIYVHVIYKNASTLRHVGEFILKHEFMSLTFVV